MVRGVSVDLTANPAGFIAGFGKAEAAAVGLDSRVALLSKNMKLLGGVFVAVEGLKLFTGAAKSAGEFQAQITRLKTDANETAANLGMISKGVIALSNATGTSTTEINAGLYKIESAGIHGAAALTVAKAAAEGARVGFADVTTVADALTTAMTDYHLKSDQANSTTNELIATVSRGKTNLEALSGSLYKVLPVAAQAHIGLDQVLGAMATMTAQGTDAASAATYLRQTVTALANPLPKARAEMKGLGLDSLDVSKNLGQRGLTGTLQVLTDAIHSKLGPAGTVILDKFTQSKDATVGLQTALNALPPTQQTVVASLADLVGGAKSMQAILQLTGDSAATFNQNVKEIGASTQGAGKDVKDWDVIQKNFNQKLAEAKTRFHNLGLVLGQEILPVATKFAGWLSDAAGWLTKYPALVEGVTFTLLGAGGLILGLKLTAGAIDLVRTAMGRSIAIRGAMTGSLLAQGAAADKAAGSFGRLAVAENSIGLRTPLAAGALSRLGLAGAAATGGETAAIGGLSATALGAAIAAPIVLSLGSVFALYKIDQATADPSARNDRSGKGANFNNPTNAGAVAPGAIGGGYNAAEVYVDEAMRKYGPKPGDVGHQIGGVGAGAAVSAMKALEAAKANQQLVQTTQALLKVNGNAELGWHKVTASMIDNRREVVQDISKTGVFVSSAGTLTTHLGTVAKALQGATDKAAGLTAGLALLNGNAIDAARAQDGFQQQINNLAASFDKHTKTLKGNSNAAIQNRGLVDELVQANDQAAQAVLKHTGSVAQARQTLVDNAKALERNVTAVTGSKKATDEFLSSIGALPAQVSKAFDGLKQVGMTYGGALVDGFAGGIQQHMGDAILASQVLVAGTKQVFRTGLKMQSPSKVTHEYGGWVATGFGNGITDGSKKATAAAAKLAKDATSAMEKDMKAGLSAVIHAMDKHLAVLKASLTKWQQLLSSARNNRDQAGATAKGVFTSTGDLSAITGQTIKGTKNWDGTTTADTTAPITAADINASLTASVAKDKKFLADWKQAKKQGLKEPYASQILGYGPDAGEPILAAILSGGKAEINQVNTLEGQIGQFGNQAAKIAEGPFNKQIATDIAEIRKLTAEQAKETKARDKAKAINLTINTSDNDARLKQILKQLEAQGIRLNLKLRTG